MTTDRDTTTRVVRSWLQTDEHESAERLLDAVLDRIDTTPQRRADWPAWRTPTMNRFATIALGAAAVVAVILVGSQLLASPTPGGLGGQPTATPEASVADPTSEPAPSSSAWTGIPQGPFIVTGTDDPVQVTFSIDSPDWYQLPGLDGMTKDDDGLDPPQSVGAALLAWGWPAGTGFNVSGDPCQWSTTMPATSATTPDEIAAAFAAQAMTEATAPVDVTVGGFAGKAVTLHVPMTFDDPNATREEKFGDCDNDDFVLYGTEDEESARNAQGAGQIDELWILDVDGAIMILDAAYSPATPADLVEQMRAMVESAVLEAP